MITYESSSLSTSFLFVLGIQKKKIIIIKITILCVNIIIVVFNLKKIKPNFNNPALSVYC